jgi:DNA-binding NtrC family response regulator
LYFRLNVIALHIPPLAERRDDIPLLVQHFLQKYALQMGKTVTGIAPEALEQLMTYPFPGNVRELENIVERGIAVTGGDTLGLAQLPAPLRERNFPAAESRDGRIRTLEEQERDYIRWVLDQVGGNQTLASQKLGINRSSLWRKLKSAPAGDLG